eukprot:TRINITY_DN3151_c0_g1_i1.p1 TRINITY_DN3151_c0_g1~~TRINITY_DN3151_c0_g1_i1.p1  ORF type:complete len:172 (-),score=13.53 TRINITY_DN3151_c0_g1_i1:470-985(-)
MSSDRTHNKSGLSTLSVLEENHEKLLEWKRILDTRILCGEQITGLVQNSKCILLVNQKGTLVVDSKHVCYGYQLVAYFKFGRDVMSLIKPSKEQTDLVISHICGTRNCCNADHLLIEPKSINEERTHCHFVMKNALKDGEAVLRYYFSNYTLCRHAPSCGSFLLHKVIKYC